MKLTKKLVSIGSVIGSALLPFAVKAATIEPLLGLNYASTSGLGTRDFRETISSIINVTLSLLGVIVLCIIIYGGFLWMTAGGNDDKVADAKKWIFGGIIGLVIILSAYAIAQFVISNLVSATSN